MRQQVHDQGESGEAEGDERGAVVGRQRPPARPGLRRGEVPTASRVGDAAGAAHGAPYDPDHVYALGLQRVLDGLGVLIDTSGG